MAIYTDFNETIEGGLVELITRKPVLPGTIVEHPLTKEKMLHFKMDRNSYAEVKSMYEPQNDEMKEKTSTFHRNAGDALEADSIIVYVNGIIPVKFKVKEGVIHRHGANIATTRKHTIATICTPLAVHLKRLGYTANKITAE